MSALSPILRSGVDSAILFWCPGCNTAHRVQYGSGEGPRWHWNMNAEKPTFSPSVKVSWKEPSDKPEEFSDEKKDVDKCCHSFVRDGMIEFLSDCTHSLAGKTVPLAKFPHSDWS